MNTLIKDITALTILPTVAQAPDKPSSGGKKAKP